MVGRSFQCRKVKNETDPLEVATFSKRRRMIEILWRRSNPFYVLHFNDRSTPFSLSLSLSFFFLNFSASSIINRFGERERVSRKVCRSVYLKTCLYVCPTYCSWSIILFLSIVLYMYHCGLSCLACVSLHGRYSNQQQNYYEAIAQPINDEATKNWSLAQWR